MTDQPVVQAEAKGPNPRLAQVLGVCWVVGSLLLVVALGVDAFTREGGFHGDTLVVGILAVSVPIYLGVRLFRQPNRRLAMWSSLLALLPMYAAVIYASDASVSRQSNAFAAPLLIGSLALFALSLAATVRYRRRRLPRSG